VKIGLTYTGSQEKHENYVRWLKRNENIEVLKLSVENKNAGEIKNCDGLLLSGGRDIHPKYYGSGNSNYRNAPQDGFDENRDEFEISVFKLSQESDLPVLAVCRGMQLVNCILGGNLKQDLGRDLNLIHRAENGNDKAHGLNIESGTQLGELTNNRRVVVNSAHHQSIKRPASGLRVNCVSDDGTIEGLEWADGSNKPFLICIQWHPERMFKFDLENSAMSATIRNKFIEEIKKTRANKK
jgi:putative glutamine amidotransferase